jgi:hypothetical protein
MIIGTEIQTGKSVKINLKKIIEGRMLIQANSGGGKSYTIRKFVEITHGHVQQIIIDIEGEFASLREKFDYILIAKDGDIQINLKSAELLAKRLLELNTSTIIDLYELKHQDRIKFVKLFFDAMINAPKELWHSCLVVLDEGHIFAPEKGAGEAESADAVKDMATRGRKRGFALVVATQRLSKLDKNVVAELNTKLIGRSSLDVDMKRSAYELGFTQKEDIFSLRSLAKGEFYAFGSGLSDSVIKIKIGKVETTHFTTGAKYIQKPIQPTDKIKQSLAKLADLPQEAEKELQTKEDYQKQIIILKRELSVSKQAQPKQDPRMVEMAYDRGYKEAEKFWIKQNEYHKNDVTILKRKLDQIKSLSDSSIPARQEIVQSKPKFEPIPPPIQTIKPQKNEVSPEQSDVKLRDGAMKMLKSVAMYYPNPVTKNQIATLAGFSVGGGTFTTYLSDLRRLSWVNQNGDMITITDEGLAQAGNVEPVPTDSDQLLNMWCSKFREGAAKMLREIAKAYPSEITKDELAANTNFTKEGGTFTTYLSELRRNGLIDVQGESIKASKELFPEMTA